MSTDLFRSSAEARSFIDSLCDKEISVHITDGRCFVGRLWCTDHMANLVLGHCTEYPAPSDTFLEDQKRNLTTIVIPGRHIIKIECSSTLVPP
ncbi:unnamed protein product, partial [Dicrocoelium dendriticum]